jgi:hypothetical protein
MPKHRFVEIAGFSPDPSWSLTQAAPAPAGLVNVIQGASYPTTMLWRGIGYDGADKNNSVPVNSTGITFNAALVYRDGREYRRLTSIGETLGSSIEAGRDIEEVSLPAGFEGWIRMIALVNAGPSTATHLCLSYEIRRHSQ